MNICVFGDSITWGACDYFHGGWVNRLRNYFEERGDTPLGADGRLADLSVYNLGICGDTTDDLKERFEVEAMAREPGSIIFAIGINDARRLEGNNQQTGLAQFEKNILELVNSARKFTKKIVFVGLTRVDEAKTTPIPWNTRMSYYNQDIDQYDEIIREVCKKEELEYIDAFGIVQRDDLEDGLHPNSEGHKKMFEKIKEDICKLI